MTRATALRRGRGWRARLGAAGDLAARPRDAWLLLPAQIALVRAQVELWTRPVGHLVDEDVVTCASAAPHRAPGRRVPSAAHRLARAVTRAAQYGLFRPTCLVRAVALHRLLERHGIEHSRVRVGVRRPEGVFAAHAWVELHGVVLDEGPDVGRRYVTLDGVRVR